MEAFSLRKYERVSLFVFGAVLFAALAFLGGFLFRITSGPPREWAEHSFAGIVTARTATTITVEDGRGTSKDFTLELTTMALKGRDIVSTGSIDPGTYVIVEAKPVEGGIPIAATLRLINAGKIPSIKRGPTQ